MRIQRIIAFVVALILAVPACIAEDKTAGFKGLNDPSLLPYLEESLHDELTVALDGEDYIIEDISAIYISEESLIAEEFNTRENVYFGYKKSELEQRFQGKRYVFTLGTNNETVVEEWEEYDDTYDRVIRNIAIGAGVILICATVSVVAASVGLTTTSIVFAVSAKTGAQVALSSGVLCGVAAGVIKERESGDIHEAVKQAALTGSEAFKWGAITGVATGSIRALRDISRGANWLDDTVLYEPGRVVIPENLREWQKAQLRALNKYGGYEELTYLEGEQVPHGTLGGTRPDVVRLLGDHIEAIEVKYFNLEDPDCVRVLYKELEREVGARVINLPKGSTQRIVLDVTKRGFSQSTIDVVKNEIWKRLENIYPEIPIDFVGV